MGRAGKYFEEREGAGVAKSRVTPTRRAGPWEAPQPVPSVSTEHPQATAPSCVLPPVAVPALWGLLVQRRGEGRTELAAAELGTVKVVLPASSLASMGE